MRCKDCGTTTKNTQYMCWSKWQLCLKCAVKKYPEEYKQRQIGVNVKASSIRYGRARRKGAEWKTSNQKTKSTKVRRYTD